MNVDAPTTQLLSSVASLLDRSVSKELCERCMTMIIGNESHHCDPEERAAALVRASLGYLVGGPQPKARAKGYGIR